MDDPPNTSTYGRRETKLSLESPAVTSFVLIHHGATPAGMVVALASRPQAALILVVGGGCKVDGEELADGRIAGPDAGES
jgi:hypothetical protein